jgi:hypothetical protein
METKMKKLNRFTIAALVCFSMFTSHSTAAESWTLSPDDSLVAYGSIKANVVGEVNKFNSIEGDISEGGLATVTIDLASVDTKVDIRNQRMIQYVFGDSTKAVLTATIDMAVINALSVGDSTVLEVEGVLNFLGNDIDVDTNFFVAKLAESKILATTESMVMIPTEQLGVNAGVDKLMELAKLPSITRVTPVSLRFVFNTK